MGNLRARRIFFSLTFPLQEFFFSVSKNTFSGLLAVHECFSLNFSLHEFFLYFPRPAPPPPLAFLMVHPLSNIVLLAKVGGGVMAASYT